MAYRGRGVLSCGGYREEPGLKVQETPWGVEMVDEEKLEEHVSEWVGRLWVRGAVIVLAIGVVQWIPWGEVLDFAGSIAIGVGALIVGAFGD